MNIGFDLDGILVNTPPFVPKQIIERLYVENNKHLTYRIPSSFEQLIRKLSHIPPLRPPISSNIEYLLKSKKNNHHNYYLVSGRFGFLINETQNILKNHKLDTIFTSHHINNKNEQPHIFKNTMLKKLNIHKYIDDDLPLLEFLAKENSKIKFFWLNKTIEKKFKENLFAITHLSKMFK